MASTDLMLRALSLITGSDPKPSTDDNVVTASDVADTPAAPQLHPSESMMNGLGACFDTSNKKNEPQG